MKHYFIEIQRILDEFIQDEKQMKAIEDAAFLMGRCIINGGKIIACGNGGSMTDAMHFASELTGKFREDRHAIPAIAISDPAHLSCVANDYDYEHVFSRFIWAFAKPGDVLLAISTSGNSPNVIHAAKSARLHGMNVVALTGKDGGKLYGIANINIMAPPSKYADRAQEIHTIVIHAMVEKIERMCT